MIKTRQMTAEKQNGTSEQHNKGTEKILQSQYYEDISGNTTYINDDVP